MKIFDAADFGKAVKERRKELGYTQKYLSDFTGYSTSFISELENGKPTIELERALRLANLLGIDVLMEVRGRH
ncbi:MAG: helix-turn-helix domain-containing protein [Lachnospiraceae bacterium]|nr:helix-turn-helix domain-containing protein [Lachnospiraceae bacterium]